MGSLEGCRARAGMPGLERAAGISGKAVGISGKAVGISGCAAGLSQG